jgi:hypothetical protein
MDSSIQASIRNTDETAEEDSSTRALLHDAAERAANYLNSLATRPVIPSCRRAVGAAAAGRPAAGARHGCACRRWH